MNSFLIIQTASAGDVVLATPLLESIHAFYPAAKIDILLKKGNESLFDNHPFLNRTLIFDKTKNKLINLFKLIREVRKSKYDVVVCVQRFFSTGLITACSGAGITSGFRKNPFSPFFTYAFPHQFGTNDHFIHETDRNLSLLKHICPEKRFLPALYPPEVNPTDYGIEKQFITISPASLWFTKQLPAQNWKNLISKLPHDFQCVLLGGKEDEKLCVEIASPFERQKVIILAGKLSFLQSAGLMKKAVMNYTNDSAPMHIASAVNAAVTVVYCSTIPGFGFTPLSEKSFILEPEEKLDCRPCGLHGHRACPEKHFRCGNIDPDLYM